MDNYDKTMTKLWYTIFMSRPKTSRKELIKERNNLIKDMIYKGISQSDIASLLHIPRSTVNIVAMENMADEHEISLCIKWLNLNKKTKKVNKRYTSYNLKHIIERYHETYISNDSLIEAVKRIDMDYELAGESGRFIFLPLSSKSVKKYETQKKA